MPTRLATLLLMLLLFVAACDPMDNEAVTTPPAQLPDLRPFNARNDLLDENDATLRCLGLPMRNAVTTMVINEGQADARSFVVDVAGERIAVDGLAAGAQIRVIDGFQTGREFTVVVDVDDEVGESNEENNTVTGMILTFTPPPACTPTPTASP